MSRKNRGKVKIFEKKTEMIQVIRFLNKRKCDVVPNLNSNKVTNKCFVYGKKKKRTSIFVDKVNGVPYTTMSGLRQG